MNEQTMRNRKKLQHAYIIVSDSEAERQRQAINLSAAFVCEGEGEVPCGVCRHCKKAMSGIHPDISYISQSTDDKGQVRRDIQVDQIREIVKDAQIMTNEAKRKVYIIYEADKMNKNAQNAILKILEEPTGDAAFILCTAFPTALLETVRSRCAVIGINRAEGETEKSGGSAAKDALGLLRAIESGKPETLLLWCSENETMDTRQAGTVLQAAQELIADILCGREKMNIPTDRCLYLYDLFTLCLQYLTVNTGVKHIMGLVAVRALRVQRNEMRKLI